MHLKCIWNAFEMNEWMKKKKQKTKRNVTTLYRIETGKHETIVECFFFFQWNFTFSILSIFFSFIRLSWIWFRWKWESFELLIICQQKKNWQHLLQINCIVFRGISRSLKLSSSKWFLLEKQAKPFCSFHLPIFNLWTFLHLYFSYIMNH